VRARLALACALCFACAKAPPDAFTVLSASIADWSSIVLAALPYVVCGAFAAGMSRRLVNRRWRHKHIAVALLAVLNPGCDCALNGFAGVLARARPSLAGFALTLAAAASPASLAVTYAAFGMRMTIARTACAFIAAALTAIAWSSVGPTSTVGPADDKHRHHKNNLDDLAAALGGVACAGAAAAAAKAFAPAEALAHMAPAAAALFGALLSPCSTADPLLAVALLRDARSQLVFMLASQCLDVRQMLLVFRHFGMARMAAAAACAAGACAAAAIFA
jgi:uncharacterized membrane protein YraQ (UPF0718 family)